jgi:hypothetical protein
LVRPEGSNIKKDKVKSWLV